MCPGTLAEVAERSTSDTQWEHHLLEFLDEFYARDGDRTRQGAMIANEPGILDDPRTDAGAILHLSDPFPSSRQGR